MTISLVSKFILNQFSRTPSFGPLILMYHGTIPGNRKQNFLYAIDSARFCGQLDLLKQSGWHTACIRDLKNANQLPPKTVIITFDDGFANNYEGAFLPLTKRGMKATWFIVSNCVGSTSTWLDPADRNTNMLTAEQLCEMDAEGMEIGSHTITHPDLTTLSEFAFEQEIRQSKIELENIIQAPVWSFAFPYGRYHNKIIDCVKNSGYRFACSVRPGFYSTRASDFELPRITIFAKDSPGIFARKLAFASNAVSWNQIVLYYKNRLKSKFIFSNLS